MVNIFTITFSGEYGFSVKYISFYKYTPINLYFPSFLPSKNTIKYQLVRHSLPAAIPCACLLHASECYTLTPLLVHTIDYLSSHSSLSPLILCSLFTLSPSPSNLPQSCCFLHCINHGKSLIFPMSPSFATPSTPPQFHKADRTRGLQLVSNSQAAQIERSQSQERIMLHNLYK